MESILNKLRYANVDESFITRLRKIKLCFSDYLCIN